MTGALAADLCELNMAASYLWRGMVGPATFSLLSAAFRPAGRPDGHGLEDCLTFLERFHFDEDERARLGDTRGFNEPALDAFRRLRFPGEVWAVPEGRMVFAGEPLLGVTAPIAEAQLVEIVLLNQVTFHTAVASKAAGGLPGVRRGLPRPLHLPGRHLRHPGRGPRRDRCDPPARPARPTRRPAGLRRPWCAGRPDPTAPRPGRTR